MSHYVSKDFVHQGTGLRLDPEITWPLLSRACRKAVRQAQRRGLRFERLDGTAAELQDLRGIWYDPEDPNLPSTLPPNGHLFRAVNADGQLMGMALLLTVGNHLFLNNLAASPAGKVHRTPDFMLWSCVEHFAESPLVYIDVGVSYRPNLQRFFRRFATLSYPVIFHPPALATPVRALPFHHRRLPEPSTSDSSLPDGLRELVDEATFVPDAAQAVQVLTRLGHPVRDLTAGGDGIGYIDLVRWYPVQFGALLTGVSIDDRTMWNEHGCLDVFKRERVFGQIAAYPRTVSEIRDRRLEHHEALSERFGLDGLPIEPAPDGLVERFRFASDIADSLHDRYIQFEVEHDHEESTIGLPLHQELDEQDLDYVYAIYRGVMNLCSEWTPTAVYKPLP